MPRENENPPLTMIVEKPTDGTSTSKKDQDGHGMMKSEIFARVQKPDDELKIFFVKMASLAEVHRELVHHIVEDEVDGQEERQDDRREDRQQREESGEVQENQTHNMSAWR